MFKAIDISYIYAHVHSGVHTHVHKLIVWYDVSAKIKLRAEKIFTELLEFFNIVVEISTMEHNNKA